MLDEDAQLCYFGRRHYSPALGRFITRDPKEYIDGLNTYTYVRNNPVNLIDLLGLCKDITYCDPGCEEINRILMWFKNRLVDIPLDDWSEWTVNDVIEEGPDYPFPLTAYKCECIRYQEFRRRQVVTVWWLVFFQCVDEFCNMYKKHEIDKTVSELDIMDSVKREYRIVSGGNTMSGPGSMWANCQKECSKLK